MSLPLLLLAVGLAQQSDAGSGAAKKPAADQAPATQQEMPPEEDASMKEPEYAFNPLQATKEVRVGDFYMKRKDYKGAMQRYSEATHWNPGLAEAWRKLGESEEKLESAKEARAAYKKFLEIDPDSKMAGEVKKRMEKLGAS